MFRKKRPKLTLVGSSFIASYLDSIANLLKRPESIPTKVITQITPEPRIPHMERSWKLVHAKQDGNLGFYYQIIYNDNGRQDNFKSDYGSSPNLSFTIDFKDVVLGGAFALHVWVPVITDYGAKTILRELVISSIRGINPSKSDVKARLGEIELQVICYKESRFRQFDDKGLPLFGPPRGFGVMQLDTPPPSARQLWDWKQNVDGGKELWNRKKHEVKQHFANVQKVHPEAPGLSAEQFKLALYQYYNGGFYWSWNVQEKRWVKVDTTGYADSALAIEKSVQAGKPPGDWD